MDKSEKTTESTSFFSFKDFDKKKLAILLPLIFILITALVAYDLRSGQAHLDGLRDNVERNVYSQVEQMIRQDVEVENRFASTQQKDRLVQQRMADVRRTSMLNIQGESINVEAVIDQQFEATKRQFQTDDGQTYLVAIDPHYFLKLSENYYFNGHTGDFIDEEGNSIVSKRLAPEGGQGTFNPEFQIWFSAFMFSIYGIDENSSYGEKIRAIYFIEVIFALLAIIPLFFLIRRFADDYTAFAGSLFFVSLTMFATRTIAGFVDTDSFTVFFPVTIACFFIYAITTKRMWVAITNSLLAGLFVGLGLWAWSDNWFILVFLLAAAVGYLAYLFAVDYLETKKLSVSFRDKTILVSSGLFLFSSIVFGYILGSINLFTYVYSVLTGKLTNIAGFGASIWPNVFSSVAELSPASFNQIVSTVGGQIPFVLALSGILFLAMNFKTQSWIRYVVLGGGILWFIMITRGLFVNLAQNQEFLFLILLFLPIIVALVLGLKEKNRSPTVFIAAFFSAWMAGTIFMSFNGVRFILLMSPVFAAAFGISLYYIIKEFKIILYKLLEVKETKSLTIVSYVTIGLIFFFLIFMPVYSNTAQATSQQLLSFDDAWHDAMFHIRDNSAEDAIITSWWDFGHFFHATANRGVTFDGGTQTTPQSHWVGKLFAESNDDVSEDILRMLVCGGNQAFDTMQNIANDSSGGVLINKIIYQTLGQDVDTTRQILATNDYFTFTEEEIDHIMEYLACDNPRENYVITSGDMVGKAPVWAHWGLWDFAKKFTLDNYRTMSAERIAELTDSDVSLINRYVEELRTIDTRARQGQFRRSDAINQWLAPYPRYLTQSFQRCQQSEGLEIICLEGLRINLANETVQQHPELPVGRLLFAEENRLRVVEQNTSGVDIIIANINGEFSAMVAEYPHGSSLFTRLFFLDGLGADSFEKVYETNSLTTGRIIVWRTIWDE